VLETPLDSTTSDANSPARRPAGGAGRAGGRAVIGVRLRWVRRVPAPRGVHRARPRSRGARL